MKFAQESLEGLHGKETLDLFFNQSVFLQTGVLHSSDCETARNLGIPVWQAGHLGGSIVCFPGDLSICLTTEHRLLSGRSQHLPDDVGRYGSRFRQAVYAGVH